jgi:hypothetical protein
MAVQPTLASNMDSASTTRTCAIGVSSGPPMARGMESRNTPAVFMAATSDCGMRRSASISSRPARICGPSARAAARACSPASVWAIGRSVNGCPRRGNLPSFRRRDTRPIVTLRRLACDIPIGDVADDGGRIAFLGRPVPPGPRKAEAKNVAALDQTRLL